MDGYARRRFSRSRSCPAHCAAGWLAVPSSQHDRFPDLLRDLRHAGLQGLTLPPLIRLLGLAGGAGPDCEELEARRIVTQAALSHLEDARARDSDPSKEIYEDLTHHYRQRLASLEVKASPGEVTDHERHMELSLEALRVERETAIRLRNEGRINDSVLRRIERELDLTESRLSAQVNDF